MALYTGLSSLTPNAQMKKLLTVMECKDQRIITNAWQWPPSRHAAGPGDLSHARSDYSFRQIILFHL